MKPLAFDDRHHLDLFAGFLDHVASSVPPDVGIIQSFRQPVVTVDRRNYFSRVLSRVKVSAIGRSRLPPLRDREHEGETYALPLSAGVLMGIDCETAADALAIGMETALLFTERADVVVSAAWYTWLLWHLLEVVQERGDLQDITLAWLDDAAIARWVLGDFNQSAETWRDEFAAVFDRYARGTYKLRSRSWRVQQWVLWVKTSAGEQALDAAAVRLMSADYRTLPQPFGTRGELRDDDPIELVAASVSLLRHAMSRAPLSVHPAYQSPASAKLVARDAQVFSMIRHTGRAAQTLALTAAPMFLLAYPVLLVVEPVTETE